MSSPRLRSGGEAIRKRGKAVPTEPPPQPRDDVGIRPEGTEYPGYRDQRIIAVHQDRTEQMLVGELGFRDISAGTGATAGRFDAIPQRAAEWIEQIDNDLRSRPAPHGLAQAAHHRALVELRAALSVVAALGRLS